MLITPEGKLLSRQCAPPALSPCIFEYIYLARPDSVLNDIPVYTFQLGLGTRLAQRIAARGWDIDLVCPVPDGSRPAAIQISAELGLPYREGLVKNRYVGRTFIMPDQRLREMSVRRKLNAMPVVFSGKSVLLIDDSIVRGTTMSQIVDMVRKAGARTVGWRGGRVGGAGAGAGRHPTVSSRRLGGWVLQGSLCAGGVRAVQPRTLCRSCCCRRCLEPAHGVPSLRRFATPLRVLGSVQPQVGSHSVPFVPQHPTHRRCTWPLPPPPCGTPTSTAWTCPPAPSLWPTG